MSPRIKSFVVNAVILIALVAGVSMWQSRNLIGSDGPTQAPRFVLTNLEGKSVALGNAGTRKALYYFFAPWCAVCKMTTDNVERIAAVNKDLQVYAVALAYDKREDVERYVKDHDMKVEVLLGSDEVLEAYHIQVFPSFYFLSSKGEVESGVVGYTTTAGLWLRQLLIN
jgi:thiol-disulfide isomerase/thioredoxin